MMSRQRIGGWGGVISGVGLAAEAALFSLSGWSAVAFASLDGAAGVMQAGGHILRLAVLFGVFNLAFFTLLLVGLADCLEERAPALGAATLGLGLVGVAVHSIVPIGFYQAVPYFTGPAARPESWDAVTFMMASAQSVGTLFMSLSMIAAGVGGMSHRVLPRSLSAFALLAGLFGCFFALASGTPWAAYAGLLAMTTIGLSIVFRAWSGAVLLMKNKGKDGGRTRART